jgi:hypothetical protein
VSRDANSFGAVPEHLTQAPVESFPKLKGKTISHEFSRMLERSSGTSNEEHQTEKGALRMLRSRCMLLLLFICVGWLSQVAISQPSEHTGNSGGKAETVRLASLTSDLSNVRGFNYNTVSSVDDAHGVAYTDQWIRYNHDEVDRDMGYAQKLHLNEVRIFLSYDAWRRDRAQFREHLIDFVRTCHAHGIGVMPVLVDGADEMMPNLFEPSARAQLREWAQDLVSAIGKEPGLVFWDANNEPDIISQPKEFMQHRMQIALYMAGVLRELDTKTPVTIGCAYVPCMQELADAVDVLSFHDYSPTKHEIRENMAAAKQFAARVGKPVFNTEIGCIARANPYDLTLQEHMQAGMGWYIWELMIAQHWGDVHGVFYPDGSVRDPSLPAAILGVFRDRGPNVVLENPDREGWVTRAVDEGSKWLNDPAPAWNKGLDIAETEANLLEAAELAPMRELPTRSVDVLRSGGTDLPALKALIGKYVAILEPYRKAPTK